MNRYRITDLTTGQSVGLSASNRYEAVFMACMEDTACRIEVEVKDKGYWEWQLVGHHGLEKAVEPDRFWSSTDPTEQEK